MSVSVKCVEDTASCEAHAVGVWAAMYLGTNCGMSL